MICLLIKSHHTKAANDFEVWGKNELEIMYCIVYDCLSVFKGAWDGEVEATVFCLFISNLFFISFFPDYLNNLSPDSKEYEDTQGIVVSVSLSHNDDHWPCLNCENINCAYDCNFLSTAALVIVSEVADQVNDNLKHGVSCFCVWESVLYCWYMMKKERGDMMSS